MQIYGHRGVIGDGTVVENTAKAVQLAMESGAHGVEIDVRRASDGSLRCHHDPLPLNFMEVDELSEVLRAATGGRVIIELKNVPHEPGWEPPHALVTLAAVHRLVGAASNVVVSSFDFAVVAAAAGAGLAAAHLMMEGVSVRAGAAWALEHSAVELHVPVSTVLAEADAVRSAQSEGLAVVAWTVTESEQVRNLAEVGVDAVICNDPGSVLRALNGH